MSRALLASALLVVASCSSDRKDAEPAPQPLATERIRAFVAHRDARASAANGGWSAPSFVWLARDERVRFASAREAGAAALKGLRATFGLDDETLASVEALAIDDAGGGPVIARFRQRDQARGLDVFRGGLAIAMSRTFDPVSASGFLVRSLAGADRPFVRSAQDALRDAHATTKRGALAFTSQGATEGGYETFTAPGLAEPARVKKVLYPQGEGVVPAYYVELQIAHGPALSFVVAAAAAEGQVLFTNDLVRADVPFGYRIYGDATTKIPLDGPQGNGAAPHPTGKPNGFRPTFGATQLVTLQNYPFSKNDPWLPVNATSTSGNNVRAYADLAAPDGITSDTFTPVTAPNLFDYAYDTTLSPGATPTNVAATVTHLFYVTNFLHDWYYDVGFDENAGNHQIENFGRGGIGRDALKAEAQDFEGRNNANATVPADGSAPRLQMYVFSGPSVADINVLAPPAIAGAKKAAIGGFGNDAFDLTGSVVLASDDQGADAADACEPLTIRVTGKIALVHRGLCSFVQKAQNVQKAGAIGCIVANVTGSAQPNEPPFMGGTSADITIPVLSLALPDGQALEAAIPAGATLRMHRALTTDLDGSLDTTIVAHEWGHVISGRLIGDGSGLNTNQSGGLGEGWADFSGLLLMVRADDVASPAGGAWAGAYPNGAYATSGGGADFYFGIRRVPYSTDFTKDPLTLKHIQNGSPLPSSVPIAFGEDGSFNAEVHNTGEVWATMLWECYASLLRDPRFTFAEAQARMKRYYVASLKLTPPDPTILEARDAVLAAALASDPKDYELFWGAFGRRGAGVGAEGPSKESSTNQGVRESFSVANDVQISAVTLNDDVISCDHDGMLDEGEIGTLAFAVRNAGPGTLQEPTATLSSTTAGVTFPDGATVKLGALVPFSSVKLKMHVQVHGVAHIAPVAIDIAVTDPSFGSGRVTHFTLTARVQSDEAPETATIDHVDTRRTAWTVLGEDTSATTTKWARTTDADGRWTVPNAFEIADHTLVSPAFTIEGTTFELAFKHRWAFRISTRRKVDVDGGVVEVSVDKGKTWKDAAELGTVDYNTTIDTGGRGDNPLKGRRAYGNKSSGYPEQWVTSRMKLDLKAQPASVKVRFHVASGSGFSGAPGWEVDDIALIGISSKPFWSIVEHADACDGKGPTADAGPPQTVKSKQVVTLTGSGTHPTDEELAFAWTQVAGTPVVLKQDGSPTLSFEAPDTVAPISLTFELRANDGALLSPGSRVEVVVVAADPTRLQAGGGGCSTSRRTSRGATSSLVVAYAALGLVALGLLMRRRLRR